LREFRLISEAINNFGLNLNGITVLTEAASGNYIWTPIIAALAGAKVFAYSANSKYATYKDVYSNTMKYAEKFGVKKKIVITDRLDNKIINKAEIKTNLGFLRPLDKKKLKHCNTNAVIPLMWETWEFRNNDLDLNYCIHKDIPVMGTNEDDIRLRTYNYLGLVIKKVLLEKSIEVFKSKILLLGKGKFKKAIYDSLIKDGAHVVSNVNSNYNNIKEFDAIVIADHETNFDYISNKGLLKPKELKSINKNLIIIHVCGNIDRNDILKSKIRLVPKDIARLNYMSLSPNYLGPKPVIELHAAGLKVGYEMLSAKKPEEDFFSISDIANTNNSLCQKFPKSIISKYYNL
jgi:hypothetical protein